MSKINEIKKLAGKSLTEKWEKIDSDIYNNCSFCVDSIKRRNELMDYNIRSCEICYIPKILCNNSYGYSLFDIITHKTKIFENYTIEEFTNNYSYKLFVDCLKDLRNSGKISDVNISIIKDFIERFKMRLE